MLLCRDSATLIYISAAQQHIPFIYHTRINHCHQKSHHAALHMTCKTAAAAAFGYSLRLVCVGIYNCSPSTNLTRVSRSLGIGWGGGNQSVWQAAEKEQSKGPAAASQPTIVKVLFPSNLHILCQLGWRASLCLKTPSLHFCYPPKGLMFITIVCALKNIILQWFKVKSPVLWLKQL